MKADGILRPVIVAFVAALAIYFVFYTGIEHRRTRKGPWQVAFTNHLDHPAIIINQPALGITNVQIIFAAAAATNVAEVDLYREPREVPYPVPYGKCLFMDTTFLPGTIVFELFGHEIQLIPRVLTIDKREQPWSSGVTVTLVSPSLTIPPPDMQR